MIKSIFPLLFGALFYMHAFANDRINYYPCSDARFEFMGRFDYTDNSKPKLWATAGQVKFTFKGSSCYALISDEVQYGKDHNYIDIVVDGVYKRIRLTSKENKILVAENLPDRKHEVSISKSTEAGIGYITFIGIFCRKLSHTKKLPLRRMEFFGDSITSAMGGDTTATPCHHGDWYDQTNGYMGYAALTARNLNARFNITSVSGIGLVHSCCGMDIVMPQVFDKINLRDNKIEWDFSKYQPDVLTICLGQNDGIQDSITFCSAYVKFIRSLRKVYPTTRFVCLSSPMADDKLLAQTSRYLPAIVASAADKNLFYFMFTGKFNGGCDYHPSLAEHKEISKQLTIFVRAVMKW